MCIHTLCYRSHIRYSIMNFCWVLVFTKLSHFLLYTQVHCAIKTNICIYVCFLSKCDTHAVGNQEPLLFTFTWQGKTFFVSILTIGNLKHRYSKPKENVHYYYTMEPRNLSALLRTSYPFMYLCTEEP